MTFEPISSEVEVDRWNESVLWSNHRILIDFDILSIYNNMVSHNYQDLEKLGSIS